MMSSTWMACLYLFKSKLSELKGHSIPEARLILTPYCSSFVFSGSGLDIPSTISYVGRFEVKGPQLLVSSGLSELTLVRNCAKLSGICSSQYVLSV